MKSGVSGGRLAAGIFSLILILLSSAAFANVGRTMGTYGVSSTGAATYSIPIWAPRGPNGLEPHMTLVYNSQQASSYLGVGWSLAGVSAITRCNRTVAQDGTAAPVALTTNDALCLDGQRLQVTGGTYGEAGSTYQTEVANFEQVTAYGSAGNGPAYFIVQAPNGTQYEYGNDSNGAGSQVLAYGTTTALTWYLDKITDPAGNTMTFSYESAGYGSAVPATVSWTPSSYGVTTYDYTMQFAYGSNSAASSYYGYAGGTEVTNTKLLQSITVNYQGATVKKYALTYQPSSTTGAEVLAQVEECADAGQSNCLAPTTFAYQAPPVGTSSTATMAASNAASGAVWNYDFNGDGRADLAYCTPSPSLLLEVAFASPSGGYGAPINTGLPCSNDVLYGDFLGTGQDGILAPNGSTWYYYQWNGSSFVGQSTGLALDSASLQYVAADVEGDGRPDLVELSDPGSPMTITISVRHNTSSASSVSFSSTNAVWYSTTVPNGTVSVYAELQSGSDGQSGILETGNVKRLDFNGDGRDDLAFEYQTVTCIMFRGVCRDQYADSSNELISTGSSFTETTIATQGTMTAPEVAFLNFNSDKCTDYLVGSTIYVSGCNGTAPATVSVPSPSVVGIMDWNADGRGDILVNNGGTIGVYESTGTGLGSLITTSIPYSSLNQYFGFDQAGDQLDALGVWGIEASPNYDISYYPHNGTGVAADLITSITDGYGNTIQPAYVSLSFGKGSTYMPASDASFPYENDPDPLYVVSQVTLSDPSNPPDGTYQETHYYSGALMNEQGRGFAGFETHSVYDSRNQLYEKETFNPIFPFTGTVTSDTVTEGTASGQTVSSVANTLSDTTLDSTPGSQRYFPYVSASTEKGYEVGGTDNGDLVKTRTGSYGYDDYGNLTSATQTTSDPSNGNSWTTTVTNTLDVSTSTWCLNLLTESQISYTASNGSPSVTRTRDYTPDTTHCRYSEITTEPASSSYKVTEALDYDTFGNIDSDTITGINMAARQSSANWGATGQFPMSVTDASGATTQFNYNFNYGLVSSETDPNGLTTSWVYGDGFGRLTQETRPDGTYTTYVYSACDSGNGYCGYPDLRFWAQIGNFGSDGSELN